MYVYRAQTVRVIDGDTCILLLDLGCDIHFKTRVRLYGLNTPEIHSIDKNSEEYAQGIKARNFLEGMITDHDLIVHTYKMKNDEEKRGKYGRYLATIWRREDYPDKPSINQQLLDNQLAVPYFGGKR